MISLDEKKKILDELSKVDTMLLCTAYLYAKNFTQYGVDVTRAWYTATQQAVALERAYMDGYETARREADELADDNRDFFDKYAEKSTIEMGR